jgi:hypothetical protein
MSVTLKAAPRGVFGFANPYKNPYKALLKEYRMVSFRARLRDPCTRDVSRFFTLSESRETSQVHGSRYPARKNHSVKLCK